MPRIGLLGLGSSLNLGICAFGLPLFPLGDAGSSRVTGQCWLDLDKKRLHGAML